MSETFLYGVLTFLLILMPLVLIHEAGHFFTAKLFKVKVLEFGFGFPPKIIGFWTGRTEIKTSSKIIQEIEVGKLLGKVLTFEIGFFDERKLVESVREVRTSDFNTITKDDSIIVGKLRSAGPDNLIIADMLWSINSLPIGGFVKLVGEESPGLEGSLGSKTKLQRLIVMSSGALINLLIPFILFPIIFMLPNETIEGKIMVRNVFPDSPAHRAGLRTGDVIAAINDKEVMQLQHLQMLVNAKLGQSIKLQVQEGIPNPFPRPDQSDFDYINTFKEVTIVPRWKPPRKLVVSDAETELTEISVKQARIFDPLAGVNDGLQVVPTITNRLFEISLKEARLIDPSIEIGDKISITPTGGEDRSISVIESRLHHPLLGSNTYVQEGAMGVHISLINPQYKKNTPNFFDAATSGWRQVLEILVTTKNAIKSAIIGSTNPQFDGPAAVGPIGIGQLTGEVALSDANTLGKITTLLSITATISLSLGIINLLPIPALDGGRIFFVLIEIIRGGKRISPNKEGLIHLIGFGILIGLVVLVSIQDVVRIWNGESFF